MFVTNYFQSNVIALCCNFDSLNTVCACMVMQIKLVVVVVYIVKLCRKIGQSLRGGKHVRELKIF